MMTFEQLYETYFKDVYRFAFWLSRNQSEAEDLASETFVRAWAQRHRLRTETLKAYLLAIARSAFLDLRRKVKDCTELPRELPDRAPDPHRQATARMELDHVRRVMALLPELDRVALVLRAEHPSTVDPTQTITQILYVKEFWNPQPGKTYAEAMKLEAEVFIEHARKVSAQAVAARREAVIGRGREQNKRGE